MSELASVRERILAVKEQVSKVILRLHLNLILKLQSLLILSLLPPKLKLSVVKTIINLN